MSGRLARMATREGDETPALRAVSEARAAMDKADRIASEKRLALLDRMVDAAVAGELISRIAKRAKYEGAYVRRQLRARGVEPKQPNRTPPPGFRREHAEAE